MLGMILKVIYIVFVEGCCGYLGKIFIELFNFDIEVILQYYVIGFKEIWDIDFVKY